MKKTKILLLIFVIAISMLIFPNIVSAATIEATETTTTSTGKNVKWSYELDSNDNIINLKCTNISEVSGDLEIPSTIDGYTVLTIGETNNTYSDGAFEECSGLTGITIPNTVTTIGNNAFKNCIAIKTLTIPDSVTSIGTSAFSGCKMSSLTLSKNLISIGEYSFSNCTGLKTITFPESVIEIGKGAFSGCSGLSELIIPDNVIIVGASAFKGCSGLKNVTLSKSITEINNDTFANCTNLTSIILPESVTTIHSGAYYWEGGAFENCSNLEKVLIPDSVTSIGEYAFEDCDKLTIYGNDGMTSKEYAEEHEINFRYISQWNDSNVGDDVISPEVISILVPYSSVAGYRDSNSDKYIIPTGKVLTINVKFSENIVATEVPTLTIKFGNGSNITLTEASVSGSTIEYTYIIAKGDVGIMSAVSLVGGNVTDEAGNAAELSCPILKTGLLDDEDLYANGTVVDVEDGNNNNNNDNNNDNNNNNDNPTADGGNKPTDNNEPTHNKPADTTTKPDTSKKEDTTTSTGKLPQTGVRIEMIISVLVILGIGIFAFCKYKNLRNI